MFLMKNHFGMSGKIKVRFIRAGFLTINNGIAFLFLNWAGWELLKQKVIIAILFLIFGNLVTLFTYFRYALLIEITEDTLHVVYPVKEVNVALSNIFDVKVTYLSIINLVSFSWRENDKRLRRVCIFGNHFTYHGPLGVLADQLRTAIDHNSGDIHSKAPVNKKHLP